MKSKFCFIRTDFALVILLAAMLSLSVTIACTPAFHRNMIASYDKYKEGCNAYDAQRWADAEVLFTDAINTMYLADSQYGSYTGDYYLTDEGSKSWQLFMKTIPFRATSLRAYSRTCQKKYDLAFKDANWVIEKIKRKECDFNKAEKLCKQCYEFAVFVRGDLYNYGYKYYQKAIDDYTWVVENGAYYTWYAYKNRGSAYLFLGQYEVALTHFREYSKKFPKNADGYALMCLVKFNMYADKYLTGKLLSKQQKDAKNFLYSDALKDCKKALEIDPENDIAKNAMTMAPIIKELE
jgi:tetratricopeptide (TPR) repeat protein